MNNITSRILDKYYKDKLIQRLQQEMKLYFIDNKIEEHKTYTELYIKYKKYNDDMYKSIIKIENKDSLYYLIHFDKVKEVIDTGIKWYKESCDSNE